MEPSEAHHFISGRAAAPLHIRRTFRTAPSDWLRRVHWVWRLARGASAPAGQRGQAAWKLTYTLSMSTIQGWVEEDRKKKKRKERHAARTYYVIGVIATGDDPERVTHPWVTGPRRCRKAQVQSSVEQDELVNVVRQSCLQRGCGPTLSSTMMKEPARTYKANLTTFD